MRGAERMFRLNRLNPWGTEERANTKVAVWFDIRPRLAREHGKNVNDGEAESTGMIAGRFEPEA